MNKGHGSPSHSEQYLLNKKTREKNLLKFVAAADQSTPPSHFYTSRSMIKNIITFIVKPSMIFKVSFCRECRGFIHFPRGEIKFWSMYAFDFSTFAFDRHVI